MKKALTVCGIGGWLLISHPLTVQAAVITQILSFSPARIVIDTASGSQPNFTYRHQLEQDLPKNAEILSARLSLSHSGNTNAGPTQELWRIYSGSTPIAFLGTSLDKPLLESWDLPVSVLSVLAGGEPRELEFSLVEETPYNSERLELSSSELRLEYRNEPAKNIPEVPEPVNPLLLALGAALSGVFRKVSGAKETS